MGVCHFDVESGTFKGKLGTLMWPSGTLMLPFAKIPFRLRIVLSRLFVTKIQPEVCSSIKYFVSVPERLAGSLSDRWSSSPL